MIKQLRKRHFQIWSAMLILVPCGIISATLVIPKQTKNALLQPPVTIALPVVIKTMEKPDYTVNLRGNSQIPAQLEWINKTALIVPTAVIYKIVPAKKDIENMDVIGRIESKGTYHFDLKNGAADNFHFILYDFIHRHVIDSINFIP